MINIQPWMPSAVGLSVLFFWSFREIKAFLFWMYLWQLKNYHIGRLMAHFDTYNGKKTLFDKLMLVKYVLFAFLFLIILSSTYSTFLDAYISNYLAYFLLVIPLLFLIYFIEGLVSIYQIMRKGLKVPELTSKVRFLLPIVFIPLAVTVIVVARLFINDIYSPSSLSVFGLIPYAFSILAFDILTPLIVSFVILLLQPVTIIMRNRIIKRAMEKRQALENLLTIGITGSFGKSSVKEFLKTILSSEFKVVSTSKNNNSELGISECILEEVNGEHEIFVCEMGAYNRNGIKILCDIVKPKIGILTGINNQHLATFGSQKNIIKSKFELIDSLPEEGLAVLNWDSEHIRDNFNYKTNCIKYSINGKEDVWAEDIKEDKESISFKLVSNTGESQAFEVNVMGIQNVSNLLAAVAVARKLGMSFDAIAAKAKEIKPEQGGLKLIKSKDGFSVIDATYSSNINGLMAHLDYLRNFEGRKILIMPCLIELNGEAKETHYKMGRRIGEVCDMAIITSRDYFKDIKRGAVETGIKPENIIFMDKADKIYNKIMYCIRDADVILLESRPVPGKLMNKLIDND